MAQTVVRQSLRRLMPDAAAVLRNMFATLQIQEPAFKNVVVLYRRKVAASPQRKSEYEPIRSHNLVRPSHPLMPICDFCQGVYVYLPSYVDSTRL